MKKFYFYLLSCVTMSLLAVSCSNNIQDVDTDEPGNPALLNIKFENPSISRAAPTNVQENTINNGYVLVFRSSDGVLDGSAKFTSISNNITVKITAGTRDVYVFTNVSQSMATFLDGVNHSADLLSSTPKYNHSELPSNGLGLPMSGKSLNLNTSSATIDSPASLSLVLTYVCSKVTIQWDLSTTNPAITGMTVNAAYILNVPSQTNFFLTGSQTSLTEDVTSYLYGRDDVSAFTASTYYPGAGATNTNSGALKLTPITLTDNYFYIFENKKPNTPTIVVVEATKGSDTYFYPVVINGPQNTTGGNGTATVVRGQYYTVKAFIKGFGNTDPYAPISNANLNVSLSIAPWNPVLVTQEFN